MEASEKPQLPLDEASADGDGDGVVRALDDRLVIERLTVTDERAARVVRERAEIGQQPARTVSDAIEIGARVLDREDVGAEVDYVRAEFERASGQARSQLIEQSRGVVEEIQREFERAFSAEGGSLALAFGEFEDGLAEQIAANFGADRSTAVQHQIKEQVSKLVEERLQTLIRHFASDDAANPFADAKRAISQAVAESTRRQEARVQAVAEALQRVETSVVRLTAEGAGTRKGRSFEERVHAAIARIAEARGDCAHHVGDERGEGGSKKGDTVVELGAADGQSQGRIVFEDKDDQLSRNKAWEELNAAMAERDADFAVLVVAGEENIPAKREQLVEYEGNKMIVAVDSELPDELGLDLAYRYARLRVLTVRDRSLEVDAARVRDAAEAARSALKRAQTVRLALSNVDKSSAKAREGVDAIVAEVEAELARIESLVAAAG
jgi:uncharacterized protein DUF2130